MDIEDPSMKEKLAGCIDTVVRDHMVLNRDYVDLLAAADLADFNHLWQCNMGQVVRTMTERSVRRLLVELDRVYPQVSFGSWNEVSVDCPTTLGIVWVPDSPLPSSSSSAGASSAASSVSSVATEFCCNHTSGSCDAVPVGSCSTATYALESTCNADCGFCCGYGACTGATTDECGAASSEAMFYTGPTALTECQSACHVCGDGVETLPEECDDWNTYDGDGCSATCTDEYCCNADTYTCNLATLGCVGGAESSSSVGADSFSTQAACVTYCLCGNNIQDAGEECDDGNKVNGDGCSATCVQEYCCNSGAHLCSEAAGACSPVPNYAGLQACQLACNCGNGSVEPTLGEECDDGNADNTDACTDSCLWAVCGDTFTQPLGADANPGGGDDEACDTGGNSATCDNDCTAPACNDGIWNVPAGEACDGGADCIDCVLQGYCCTPGTPSYTCPVGNSDTCIDPGEQLFSGPYGESNCSASCGASCGNDYLDAGEECDDGNTNDLDGCSSMCETEIYCCEYGTCSTGTVPPYYCYGAGYPDAASCEAECTYCGDGTLVVAAGEECDEGDWNDNDGCSPYCTLEYCCDSVNHSCSKPDPWSCDWENFYSDATGCDVGCAYCGDGVKMGLEQCDDGAANSNTVVDACRLNCRNAYCGDGVQDTGEVCDTAVNSLTCDSDCTAPLCGDGLMNAAAGEECDDGGTVNGDGCTSLCKDEGYCCEQANSYACTGVTTRATCMDPGEVFYEGDSLNCSYSCNPYCGNSYTDAGEECDDGNYNDGDGCTYDCTLKYCCLPDYSCSAMTPAACSAANGTFFGGYGAQSYCNYVCQSCGNGNFEPALGEECDDGNDDNSDACTNACRNADCGDGYTWYGYEQCDDANLLNTDACLNTCLTATCGDSYIRTGVEECDDGNAVNDDGCSACKVDVYCCSTVTALCSETTEPRSTCTSGVYSTVKSTCEASCGVVDALFCDPNKACFGYPGDSTFCSNPVVCGEVGSPGWDCDWNCNGAGALGDGNYARCMGAYKCACLKGGGSKDVTEFLTCYPSGSNDMILLNTCITTYCSP